MEGVKKTDRDETIESLAEENEYLRQRVEELEKDAELGRLVRKMERDSELCHGKTGW